MPNKRLYLTLNDRVRRNGECYRPAERLERAWALMHVVDGVMVEDDDDAWLLTDKRQQELRDAGVIAIDENYFSTAGQLLSARHDDSDLNHLSDAEMRTIAWKVQWCVLFNRARAGLDGHDKKPPRTPKGFEDFIEREKEAIHRWYLRTFKMTRPPGRDIVGMDRKPFDYPGPTTLREWVDDYEEAGHRQIAFEPGYARCGNRRQIDERVLKIIERHVDAFASRSVPTKDDIYRNVDADIEIMNRHLPKNAQLTVEERSVRRRINKLPPMFVDAGQLGTERASLKYTPVGQGIQTYDGLEKIERMGRVEMDDWEMDLFAILDEPEVRATLDATTRKAAKEVRSTTRCTITVGIDIVTRCVVALNVTPYKPSTMGSRAALDSMFVDKTAWARHAQADTDWPMRALPREIATDGGPAFEGDFRESVGRLGITHRYPGRNPTSRGHIERFFQDFMSLCRMFTGQAFANVVKRGDYDAENLASVTAHELERLVVRFIVDDYHLKTHDGLGGMCPYTAWQRSTNVPGDVPSDVQRHAAFGIRRTNLRIRATGITFMHVQYKHPRMAILHGHVERRHLTGVINPNDLGTLLVLVPEEAKRALNGTGDYMEFKADAFAGVPLSRLEHYNDVLLDFEADEKANNRSVRRKARRFLQGAAKDARERAGVPSDTMTSEQYGVFLDKMERAGDKASKPRPAPAGAPMSDADEPDTLGVSVARPVGARRMAKPGTPGVAPTTRKSINRYRDEERR